MASLELKKLVFTIPSGETPEFKKLIIAREGFENSVYNLIWVPDTPEAYFQLAPNVFNDEAKINYLITPEGDYEVHIASGRQFLDFALSADNGLFIE